MEILNCELTKLAVSIIMAKLASLNKLSPITTLSDYEKHVIDLIFITYNWDLSSAYMYYPQYITIYNKQVFCTL